MVSQVQLYSFFFNAIVSDHAHSAMALHVLECSFLSVSVGFLGVLRQRMPDVSTFGRHSHSSRLVYTLSHQGIFDHIYVG